MNNRIKGFDYDTYAIVELTRAQWQERIAEVLRAGGFRWVTQRNTYVYTCSGQIKAEICTDIFAPDPQTAKLPARPVASASH